MLHILSEFAHPVDDIVCGYLSKDDHAYSKGSMSDNDVCAYAARQNNVDCLRRARLQDPPCSWGEALHMAAFHGHMGVLEWAREHKAPWPDSLYGHAIYGHKFEVLKWAHLNGCPWQPGICEKLIVMGRMDILKWVVLRGYPWSGTACTAAIMVNRLDMLEFVLDQGCPWALINYDVARRYKRTHIIEWAKKRGLPE